MKISNDEEHQAALTKIEALMDAEEGTPEVEELAGLVDLVEAYENEHYPMGEGK